jgi:hypothetical protein
LEALPPNKLDPKLAAALKQLGCIVYPIGSPEYVGVPELDTTVPKFT